MSLFVMGVSNDLKEECHSTMLHDNMTIYCIMFYAQKVEESRAKKKSRDANRARSYDCGFSNGRLDIQENQSSKRGSPIKFLLNFPRLMMIGCVTLNIKTEEVLAHQATSQLVESVARSIMVIALLGRTITLGVRRVAKSLGIALM